MQSFKVRLLSASYDRETHNIELYGRTDDDHSITILHSGFHPYLILVDPSKEVLSMIQSDPEYLREEELSLLVGNSQKRCVRVWVQHSWQVPRLRELLEKYIPILSSDIPFHQRFLYDFDLPACFIVEGDVIDDEQYTTDLVVKGRSYSPCEPFNPKLSVLSFDIECSIKTGQLLCITCYVNRHGVNWQQSFFGPEDAIIRAFEEYVLAADPDVITGWNIDGYDFPQLNKIIIRLGIEDMLLGRNMSKMRAHGSRFWRATGRVIVDCWWSVKTLMHPKRESLNFCAKEYLGEEKLLIPNKDIDGMWAKDQNYVIAYCQKDSTLAWKILEYIQLLDKSMDLATVSKLPLDDIVNGSTSTMIDSILIRAADRAGIGVPRSQHIHKDRKIEGAYVHPTVPGLYSWVCVLDFKSMYPSMIISNNICFTTLSDQGTIINKRTGAKFLSPSIRKGLVPQILEKLLIDREYFKNKMKATTDERLHDYYDGLQYAVKILMNSFYGVFASSFYRFTNPIIGESITTFAKENITNIIEKLTSTGIKVIYSDTDSVFVESPDAGREECIQYGNYVSKTYSREGVVFEFDKVFESFFTHGKKKRYAGMVVWPKEELLIRGYETRRTDSFDYQSESLEQVFKKVLSGHPDDAIKIARQVVTLVATTKDVDLQKIVISRTCKEFSFYKNPSRMAPYQAAQKLLAAGYDFTAGMKVSWIVVNSRVTPQQVEPYVEGIPFLPKPDYSYYAHRLAKTLSNVTNAFGWDESALLTGKKQMKLQDLAPEELIPEDEEEEEEEDECEIQGDQ